MRHLLRHHRRSGLRLERRRRQLAGNRARFAGGVERGSPDANGIVDKRAGGNLPSASLMPVGTPHRVIVSSTLHVIVPERAAVSTEHYTGRTSTVRKPG